MTTIREESRAIRPKSLLWLALLVAFSLAYGGQLDLNEGTLAYVEKKYGTAGRKQVAEFKELIRANRGRAEMEKLEIANRFVNRVEFVADSIHWGKQDYWATPIETVATYGGDCEDFSIAKYFVLIEMGVPESRLRLSYVRALRLNQAHMVLTYFPTPDAVPLVLDNLVREIKPATQRTDLIPIYSFSGEGLWLTKGAANRKVGEASRVSLWNDLLARMAQEAAHNEKSR